MVRTVLLWLLSRVKGEFGRLPSERRLDSLWLWPSQRIPELENRGIEVVKQIWESDGESVHRLTQRPAIILNCTEGSSNPRDGKI